MCSPAIKNICCSLTSGKSPIPRSTLPPNRVARCLFSPGRPSKELPENNFVTPKRKTLCHLHALPSFDTPCRYLLSPNELSRKVKGFVIGRGSYGTVVKGKYKNERVAVKIIPQTAEHRGEHSLMSEKNALKLTHPNIVKVYQVVRQTNVNLGFVFMELYNHTNLEKLLQCEILPFRVKLKYLKDIGSALEYCHSNDVLHLDVKPKNILINPLGNACKLCDFGGSTNLGDGRKPNSHTKGTLKYSAPELLKGETATEKTDVYSFGITMWQIIYQETPYDKEDLHVIIYKVVTQNFRPRNHLTVSNTVVGPIYTACWESEPEKRPSMSHVTAMLEEIKLT